MNKYKHRQHNIFKKLEDLQLYTLRVNIKKFDNKKQHNQQVQVLQLPLINSRSSKEKHLDSKKNSQQIFSFRFNCKSNLFRNVREDSSKKRVSSLDIFNTFIPNQRQRYNPQQIQQLTEQEKQLIDIKFVKFKTIDNHIHQQNSNHKRKNSETVEPHLNSLTQEQTNCKKYDSKFSERSKINKLRKLQSTNALTNDVSCILTRKRKKMIDLKRKQLGWIQKSQLIKKQLQEYCSPWRNDQQKQIYQELKEY